MKCPKCGKEIKNEYTYCPNCQTLLTKKAKLKIYLKELLFILLLTGSLIFFLGILISLVISSIQNANAGVQKEFLCLDACEPTILYGKEAVLHTIETYLLIFSPMLIGSIILIIVSIKELKQYKQALKHFRITFLVIVLAVFLISVIVIFHSLINTKELSTNEIPTTTDFDKVTITYKNDKINENKEKIKYYRYKYVENISGHIYNEEDINFLLNKGTYLIEVYDPKYNINFNDICIRRNKFQKANKLTGETKGFYKINDIKSENIFYKYEYTSGCHDTKLASLRTIKRLSYNEPSGFYKYKVKLKNEGLLFMSIGDYNKETIKRIVIEKIN